jgi:hypothetical protein
MVTAPISTVKPTTISTVIPAVVASGCQCYLWSQEADTDGHCDYRDEFHHLFHNAPRPFHPEIPYASQLKLQAATQRSGWRSELLAHYREAKI